MNFTYVELHWHGWDIQALFKAACSLLVSIEFSARSLAWIESLEVISQSSGPKPNRSRHGMARHMSHEIIHLKP